MSINLVDILVIVLLILLVVFLYQKVRGNSV
jgi:hypothetical protein